MRPVEIDQLGHSTIQDDVFELYIPVTYPFVVEIVKGLEHLLEDEDGVVFI